MGLNSRHGGGGDLPSLDLAFALDKTLTARKGPTPGFTRSSTATFVGSNGLIQSAAINEPRFDYDPATGASKGLLIEESRTNLATYSGVIVSGIGWFAGNVEIAVSGTGADGNASYSIAESETNTNHFVSNTGGTTAVGAASIVSGTNYTGSIFVKKMEGGPDWVQLTLGSAGFGISQYANFNIGSGTVGDSAGLASGIPPRIEEFSNGWYRCSITVTANATVANSATVILALINNTNGATRLPSYLGIASNSVFAWGAQLEAGAFPLSYIPTTVGTAARSADVCSIIGGDFSSFYNQSEGTFFSTTQLFSIGNDYTARYWGVIKTGFSNYMRASVYNQTVTQEASFFTNNDGTLSSTVASELSRTSRVAAAYQTNNARIAKNGTLGILDDSFTPYAEYDALGIMTSASGHIARIQYFRKRLSNAKLQTITT